MKYKCYGGCRKIVLQYTRFDNGTKGDLCDRCNTELADILNNSIGVYLEVPYEEIEVLSVRGITMWNTDQQANIPYPKLLKL